MRQSAGTIAKKAGAATMALAVTAAMCPALALASTEDGRQAEAPTKMTAMAKKSAKNMKQRGVKFDLKAGKWKKFKRTVYGTKSTLSYKGRVKTVKISNAKKEGYKQAKLTIEFKLAKTPSKALQRKIAKAVYKRYPRYLNQVSVFGFYLIDYSTGENLEDSNSQGVTVKDGFSKKAYRWTGKYRYKDAWIQLEKYARATAIVTYPKAYEGICVGLGAALEAEDDGPFSSDEEDAENLWYKCYHFKHDINNYHFMRIK